MEVTKPYEFIGFGAMDVTKPYKFIGFGGRKRGGNCIDMQQNCSAYNARITFRYFVGRDHLGGL